MAWLRLEKLADRILVEPGPILEAALSMALGEDDRAFNALTDNVNYRVPPTEVDEISVVLDSWFSQYRDSIRRNFSTIEDYTTIAEVLVSDGIAVVEVLVEKHPFQHPKSDVEGVDEQS